jgi:tRNA G46 methylase TrmB
MTGNSAPVHSSQTSCHERLGAIVSRHLGTSHQRSVTAHTAAAFEAICARVEAGDKPLIFDSFCGTGLSTGLLARRHPGHLVIGIDKSSHRLKKHVSVEADNYLLVHADCGDFWSLAAERGWSVERHFLYYPNPWPKPAQLKRRVHGSPHFPTLLALGGKVELRSNWQIYVEEFGAALAIAGFAAAIDRIDGESAMSLHELKYQQSGHRLWRCRCNLGHNSQPRKAAIQAR